MNKINYVKGDATQPQGDGKKVIAHICNNQGKWGAGFVMALSAKWIEPENHYRAIPNDFLNLGYVQFIQVEEDIQVANMIAQHGINKNEKGQIPLRYNALTNTLKKVSEYCERHKCTLHMPKIGAGLAGGDWKKIEKIIEDIVQVPVTIYEFE